MHRTPRIAAWLSLAIYMAAATAPCAVSPFDVAVARSLAAAEAGDAAPADLSADDSKRPAPFMTMKCPCSCTDRPHAGGVPTAPGYALMRVRPDVVPRPFLLSLAPPAPALRAAPIQAVDPISV